MRNLNLVSLVARTRFSCRSLARPVVADGPAYRSYECEIEGARTGRDRGLASAYLPPRYGALTRFHPPRHLLGPVLGDGIAPTPRYHAWRAGDRPRFPGSGWALVRRPARCYSPSWGQEHVYCHGRIPRVRASGRAYSSPWCRGYSQQPRRTAGSAIWESPGVGCRPSPPRRHAVMGVVGRSVAGWVAFRSPRGHTKCFPCTVRVALSCAEWFYSRGLPARRRFLPSPGLSRASVSRALRHGVEP